MERERKRGGALGEVEAEPVEQTQRSSKTRRRSGDPSTPAVQLSSCPLTQHSAAVFGSWGKRRKRDRRKIRRVPGARTAALISGTDEGSSSPQRRRAAEPLHYPGGHCKGSGLLFHWEKKQIREFLINPLGLWIIIFNPFNIMGLIRVIKISIYILNLWVGIHYTWNFST